jgi:hypothetical protein
MGVLHHEAFVNFLANFLWKHCGQALLGEASAALQKCGSNRSLSRQAADARRVTADCSKHRQV